MSATAGSITIGLDIGTQGCRAMAVDEDGTPLTVARHALTSVRAGQRHEQDAMSWLGGATAALRAVTDRLGPSAAAIAGLAICGTSGTIVIADDAMRPLTPGLMYDDARAGDEAPALAQAWAECAARNGYRIQPTWALAKLAWLVRHDPSVRRGRLCHVADFVGAHLAGMPVAADSSHALKSGYDLVRQCWPAEEFDRIAIPQDMLPPVVRPGAVVGAVAHPAAAATGVPARTPIVAGMTDGCASQIASGAVHPGQWNAALGTTLVLKGVSRDLLLDPDGAVYSHRHPDGGWLPGGASSSGAGALAAAFPGRDPAELDALAEPLLPTAVLSYPLATPGERFPFVRSDAEPFRVGPRRAGSDADGELAASLIQGVAFVERLCLSHLRGLGADTAGRYSVTGGATHSDLWNQVRADVLGRPIHLPRNAEAAAGMAIVAAAHGGSVAAAAERMVSDARVVEPRPQFTAQWEDGYRRMVDELERRGYLPTAAARGAGAA